MSFLGNVIGLTLDNGFSIQRAIKDVRYHEQNKKSFAQNSLEYKKLLNEGVACHIFESEVYGEYSVQFSLYQANKKIHYIIWEDEKLHVSDSEELLAYGDLAKYVSIITQEGVQAKPYNLYYGTQMLHELNMAKSAQKFQSRSQLKDYLEKFNYQEFYIKNYPFLKETLALIVEDKNLLLQD